MMKLKINNINKKGQGISMNTIIIAAIALLVLVIVSVIFMQRMGWFAQNTNDCKNYQGSCDYGRRCPSGMVEHTLGKCYSGSEIDTSNVCCVKQIS